MGIQRLLSQTLGGLDHGQGGVVCGATRPRAPPTLTGQSLGGLLNQILRKSGPGWEARGALSPQDVLVSGDLGPVPCVSADFSLNFFSLQPLLGKACL